MDWQTRLLLIGVMVATFIGLWVLGRPLIPGLRRLMRAHRNTADIITSVVMIIGGTGIWYLMIAKHDYTNIIAMVMASFLIATGIYFLVRRTFKF